MPGSRTTARLWAHLPVTLRAIVSGLAVGLIAANVWSLLLVGLGPIVATFGDLAFLGAYVWWASGHGPPRTAQTARRWAFRRHNLSPSVWAYGLVAAVAVATTVHAAMVILFRLLPFPTEAFRQGYNLDFIPSVGWRWVVVVMSALSAGVCEETGFRGYMQQPLEARHGPRVAILISAVFFTLLHLNKGWASVGMVPIVLGAGLLLGSLAWATGSLIPSMIGHVFMDLGLFAYWWTGIAGTFTARPLSETGLDGPACMAIAVVSLSLGAFLACLWRLGVGRAKAQNSGPGTD